MEDFVKRMVEEHAQVKERIEKLENYIFSDKSDNDNKVEFANKAIQLSHMRKYAECLEARLENQGVLYNEETKEYFEKVASVKSKIVPPVPEAGNDFDADAEKGANAKK